MELPRDVSIRTSWEGRVELSYLKGGVRYIYEMDTDAAYNIGLALIEISYATAQKTQTRGSVEWNDNDLSALSVERLRPLNKRQG